MNKVKVQVQVVGGDIKQLEASTVAELKSLLGLTNYSAHVNGEPQGEDYSLKAYEFVTFSQNVKGAQE